MRKPIRSTRAQTGKVRSPLHGMPVTLKDNIDTEHIRTTAGSMVYDDRVPTEDAEGASYKHRIAEIHATSMKRLSKVEAADDPADGPNEE